MWENICHYNFSSLIAKIETSVLLKNILKNIQNWKFLWLDKTFVSYYFASFIALKVVPATFLLVYFGCLKESTCETRKNIFVSFRKLFFRS